MNYLLTESQHLPTRGDGSGKRVLLGLQENMQVKLKRQRNQYAKGNMRLCSLLANLEALVRTTFQEEEKLPKRFFISL